MYPWRSALLRYAFCVLCSVPGLAATPGAPATRLLWGDTHVHTSYSLDVYMFGTVGADPALAYRFAKGLPVIHPATGARVRLQRPLDFLVVADHAEMLGIARSIASGDPRMTDKAVGRLVFESFRQGRYREVFQAFFADFRSGSMSIHQALDRADVRSEAWADIVDTADRYDEPGRFTALVGWEWTSMPAGNNLHRVVVTTAAGDTAKGFLPFSADDSENPADLWAWLDRTRSATGAAFVAIPHNSNLSAGLMFGDMDYGGRPLTRAQAAQRARWETVAEVAQYKGTSETHPLLSPDDEFASFELYPTMLTDARVPGSSPADYIRGALGRGLQLEGRLGTNPYQLGMIGSTDTHLALSIVDEQEFQGESAAGSGSRSEESPSAFRPATARDKSAAGRAAVWATANTREAIVEALRRREVYATSGPRIAVRFFGGFGFDGGAVAGPHIAAAGYRLGVPMGGELPRARTGAQPSFLIHAAKDPDGANLDRVQVVKGWVDAGGTSQERIYDVAWSDRRQPGPDGRLPAVGTTVDVKTGRYTNDIGARELSVLWSDPDFDPAVPAFYYLRVLQIPTPRYSLHDALARGVDGETTGHPASIQERAWSSPIWYTP